MQWQYDEVQQRFIWQYNLSLNYDEFPTLDGLLTLVRT